jgi:hypothetical protein
MKVRLLSVAFLLFAFSNTASSQDYHPCGFEYFLQNQHQHNHDIHGEMDSWIAESRRNEGAFRDDIYTIQVVFHIVYNQEVHNIPDEVIFDQMTVLNQDYRRLNPDANLTITEFLPVAADPKIQFELASLDPEGNPTNGIDRVFTNQFGFELDIFSMENTLDAVKASATGGADPWDPTKYLNIWVCNVLDTGFGQIFGISYPPQGTPNWPVGTPEPSLEVSGVILHYTSVGPNNPQAQTDGYPMNDYGRTLTHEIGHYLGLRHTWGDAFFNGCSVDDGFADTPNCATSANFVCNFNVNSCVDPNLDLPDMVENYMDYSGDQCQNIFTQEQVDLMRWVLTNLRPTLIEGQFVSVSEQVYNPSAKVFPNPASEQVTISFDENYYGKELQLIDACGRIVHRQLIDGLQQEISLHQHPAGVYFVAIGNQQGSQNLSRLIVVPVQ